MTNKSQRREQIKKREQRSKEKNQNMKVEVRGVKSLRNFGKPENRKISNFLILACTILCLCILSLVKSHYCPAPSEKLQVPEKAEVNKAVTEQYVFPSWQDDEDDQPKPVIAPKPKPICYESSERSNTCESEGDIRIQGSSKAIFFANTNPASSEEWKIKPYPRKSEQGALTHVKEWTMKPFPTNQSPPQCTKNFSSPAVIFSVGGYTGNIFHDFTDVLVPLFITSRKFHGDVHFLISDTKPWWVGRFSRILAQMSNYDVVDTESDEEAGVVRCYPKFIAGPMFRSELGVGVLKHSNITMLDFKGLLRKAFRLERAKAMTDNVGMHGARKPRLLIISRKKSRMFVNEKAIVAMATSLGFDVKVAEPDVNTDVAKFARLVNSADVLLGVHGAGLTNMLYLPPGAVMIQVIPLGGLKWFARNQFKNPAEDMDVTYLEYLISEDESTLIEQYPRDDPVFKDPNSIHKQGWNKLREVYLDKQNVKIHLGRLRNTLLQAIKILPKTQKS